MKLFLTNNDLVHLVKLKKTLEQSLGNRPPHSNELDGLKKGVKGIELTFRIGYDTDTNTHRTKESSMVLSFDDEIPSKQDQRVQIDKYVKDQFDFSKFIETFNHLITIFPEYRSKPGQGNNPDILKSPSGFQLPSVLLNLRESHNFKEQRIFEF